MIDQEVFSPAKVIDNKIVEYLPKQKLPLTEGSFVLSLYSNADADKWKVEVGHARTNA